MAASGISVPKIQENAKLRARAALSSLVFLMALGAAYSWWRDYPEAALTIICAGLALMALIAQRDRLRLLNALNKLTAATARQVNHPGSPFRPPAASELDELARSIAVLDARAGGAWAGELVRAKDLTPPPVSWKPTREETDELNRLYEINHADGDSEPSGLITRADMVSRLHPTTLKWLKASQAEQEFLGWDISQLRMMSFLEIVSPADQKRAKREILLAVAKGEDHGLVYRIRNARGEPRAVELSVSVRFGGNRAPAYLRSHLTDVTEEVRARRTLRRRTRELLTANQRLVQMNRDLLELQARYRDLYQNAPVMYFSLDSAGFIRDCNDTMLNTLGKSRDQLLGLHYTSILAESFRPLFHERHQTFLKSGRLEVESRWTRADNTEIDVLISSTANIDDDGQIRFSRTVAQNITARKALEARLKQQNQELAHANDELFRKNRELDEFTYVVSHDLKEPLRGLIAFSGFLLRDSKDQLTPEALEHARLVNASAYRLRNLIDDLLNLSRAGRQVDDFAPVPLAQALDTVIHDLKATIQDRHATVKAVTELPVIWGDHERIVKLLTNLVSNGLKYNRSTPPIVEIGANSTSDPLGEITLFVRDNGIGIDPRFHDKVFQLFRRLHAREDYEGTGAGLAICQKIVQAHQGRIWLESQPGAGTTFYVAFPSQTHNPTDKTENATRPGNLPH